MPPQIGVNFKLKTGRQREDERRKEAIDVAKNLYSMGLEDPQAINEAVGHFVRTGELRIPEAYTSRSETAPKRSLQLGGTTVSDLGETTVETRPVRLGKRYGIFNEGTGQVHEEPEIQGISEFLKVPAPKTEKPSVQGYNIFVDASTGAEVRREKNNSGRDFVTKVGSSSGPGSGGKETPQEKAARQTLQTYDQALKAGKGLSPDLEKRASEAAKFLKLPTEKIIGKPGFWSGLFGGKGDAYERPAFVDGKDGEDRAPTTEQKAREFKTSDEALRSGLPEGTIVMIGGKRFKLAR